MKNLNFCMLKLMVKPYPVCNMEFRNYLIRQWQCFCVKWLVIPARTLFQECHKINYQPDIELDDTQSPKSFYWCVLNYFSKALRLVGGGLLNTVSECSTFVAIYNSIRSTLISARESNFRLVNGSPIAPCSAFKFLTLHPL